MGRPLLKLMGAEKLCHSKRPVPNPDPPQTSHGKIKKIPNSKLSEDEYQTSPGAGKQPRLWKILAQQRNSRYMMFALNLVEAENYLGSVAVFVEHARSSFAPRGQKGSEDRIIARGKNVGARGVRPRPPDRQSAKVKLVP